jgi:hypothetical protein
VSFVCACVHRVAGLALPDLRLRASPPSAAQSPRRRPWSSLWRSPCTSSRPGATPATNGAPERLVRIAPPLAVASPDPQPMVRIYSRAGQTETHRSTRRTPPASKSQPPDLDPADQIRPFVLTAPFCREAPGFFQFHKNTLPPYRFPYE